MTLRLTMFSNWSKTLWISWKKKSPSWSHSQVAKFGRTPNLHPSCLVSIKWEKMTGNRLLSRNQAITIAKRLPKSWPRNGEKSSFVGTRLPPKWKKEASKTVDGLSKWLTSCSKQQELPRQKTRREKTSSWNLHTTKSPLFGGVWLQIPRWKPSTTQFSWIWWLKLAAQSRIPNGVSQSWSARPIRLLYPRKTNLGRTIPSIWRTFPKARSRKKKTKKV